jgi:hypothetical protein
MESDAYADWQRRRSAFAADWERFVKAFRRLWLQIVKVMKRLYITLARIFHAWRKRAGLSQRATAELFGMTVRNYRRWERSRRERLPRLR